METNLMLRKGIVIKIVSKTEYLVKDKFDAEEILIIISGKQRVHYYDLKISEEVYFRCSPHDSKKGRLITETDLKMDDDTHSLGNQKAELDK